MSRIPLFTLVLQTVKELGKNASFSQIFNTTSKKKPDLEISKIRYMLYFLEKNDFLVKKGNNYLLTNKGKQRLRPIIKEQKTKKIDVGTILGNRYELLELLGEGSYGSVWKAKDKQLDRTVAIKFLHNGLKDFDLLKTEAKALSGLTHKNILIVYDLDSDDENGWLITEFVDGPSLEVYLKKKVKEGKWISVEEACRIVGQCLEALEFAHDKKRVHGDIKPGNIFVPGTGEIKLGDFGVAKILSSDKEKSEGYPPDYKRRLGSPSCAAPEVLKGSPRDFQSDLFSVGVLAYILLTGQHPFMHKSGLLPVSELTKLETYSPPKLSVLICDIPEKFEKIVMRLLERDPSKRYQNAREVLDEWHEKVETIQCTSCNFENPISNKFCGQCGNDLRATRDVATEPERELSTSFALFAAGRINEAIELTEKSLQDNQKFDKGWAHLGYMLNFKRRYEEAENACTTSITLNQEPAKAYQTRGFARSNLGKFDLAVEDFTTAYEKETDERRKSMILYQRGYSKMLAGNIEDALNDALEAISLDLTNSKAQRLKERLESLMDEIPE